MSMMEVPENMVSSWRNWEKGAVRYLPPSCCFYKGSQSPWSVLVYRAGLRGRETGFVPHQQRQTGAEPLNLKRHAHWFCCSLAALQDPPQTLARTGSRRARLTLSPVCLLFGTERWADIQAPQAAPKEGSLDLQTLKILGRGILAGQDE